MSTDSFTDPTTGAALNSPEGEQTANPCSEISPEVQQELEIKEPEWGIATSPLDYTRPRAVFWANVLMAACLIMGIIALAG